MKHTESLRKTTEIAQHDCFDMTISFLVVSLDMLNKGILLIHDSKSQVKMHILQYSFNKQICLFLACFVFIRRCLQVGQTRGLYVQYIHRQ